MAAHNNLSTLMAAGKGDTPEDQAAYEEFAAMKRIYETAQNRVYVTITAGGVRFPTSDRTYAIHHQEATENSD